MTLISIPIGRCGIALHSTYTQYSADYISCLNAGAGSSGGDTFSENRAFADAIKRLYFRDISSALPEVLCPTSVVIGSDIFTLDSFDRGKLCSNMYNRIKRNGINVSDGISIEKPTEWNYDPDSIVHMQDFAYDVWARGFSNASAQQDAIEMAIGKCIEETDSLAGITSFCSLGGGTGSGVGSLVSRLIADELPKVRHLITAVMPFTFGESGTQCINSILALSEAQDTCDGIILLQNDDQSKICDKLFGESSTNLNAFNEVYALNLFHAMRPVPSTCAISNNTRYHKPLDYIIDGLCSFPALKILNVKLLPLESCMDAAYANKTHQQMISQLADMINSDHTLGDSCNSERVMLSLRDAMYTEEQTSTKTKPTGGSNEQTTLQDFSMFKYTKIKKTDDANRFQFAKGFPILTPVTDDKEINGEGILMLKKNTVEGKPTLGRTIDKGFKLIRTVENKRYTIARHNVVAACQINLGGPIKEDLNIAELFRDVLFWKHTTRSIQVSHCPRDIGLFGKVVSQLSNCQSPMASIDYLLTSTKMAYACNAYMHKYSAYGLEQSDIQQAITSVENMVSSYYALTNGYP